MNAALQPPTHMLVHTVQMQSNLCLLFRCGEFNNPSIQNFRTSFSRIYLCVPYSKEAHVSNITNYVYSDCLMAVTHHQTNILRSFLFICTPESCQITVRLHPGKARPKCKGISLYTSNFTTSVISDVLADEKNIL